MGTVTLLTSTKEVIRRLNVCKKNHYFIGILECYLFQSNAEVETSIVIFWTINNFKEKKKVTIHGNILSWWSMFKFPDSLLLHITIVF